MSGVLAIMFNIQGGCVLRQEGKGVENPSAVRPAWSASGWCEAGTWKGLEKSQDAAGCTGQGKHTQD